jgi:hypothetical protein
MRGAICQCLRIVAGNRLPNVGDSCGYSRDITLTPWDVEDIAAALRAAALIVPTPQGYSVQFQIGEALELLGVSG